ncbi:hypothetical protein [Shewanella xiamenensis]|uniref:hypothetical protein n=1 Tax=Shewanella xiamenensis TaxID=332186 RepID=UPI002E7C21BE|nr:hypothetical protein [Shewanella xiamenensis]MEE1982839.1 hypothetical protein [Shewanella xiamenensis]
MEQFYVGSNGLHYTWDVCGLWLVACGLWLVACGLWLVACGLWHDKIIDTKKPSFDGLLSSTNVSD